MYTVTKKKDYSPDNAVTLINSSDNAVTLINSSDNAVSLRFRSQSSELVNK